MSSWEKKPQIKKEELHIGCLNCSTAALKAPMDMIIAVGFGSALLWKDDELIYNESDCETEEEFMTVREAEELTAADPEHDWRIEKYGPLHGETFQRQGPEEWICIESNQGFA